MGPLKAFFRAVVAILIVVTGLLVAAATAAIAVVFFLIRRPRTPAGRVHGKRGSAYPNPPGDVIDVTANEVSVEPAKTA